MLHALPLSDYQWVQDLTAIDLHNLPTDDDEYGYFLEVTLSYPAHLHQYFSDLPPAPELRTPSGSNETKLLLTLYPKHFHVIHSSLLALYIRIGVKVEHLYRVLKFKQSRWLAEFITSNLERRRLATHKFERDFFKLASNGRF